MKKNLHLVKKYKDTPAEAEVRKTVMFDLKRVLASPHINEDLRTEAQKMMDESETGPVQMAMYLLKKMEEVASDKLNVEFFELEKAMSKTINDCIKTNLKFNKYTKKLMQVYVNKKGDNIAMTSELRIRFKDFL